jgi:hypothetical protein
MAVGVFAAGTGDAGAGGVNAGTVSFAGRLSTISAVGVEDGGSVTAGAPAGGGDAGGGEDSATGGSRRMIRRDAIPPAFAALAGAEVGSRRALSVVRDSVRLFEAVRDVASPARGPSSSRGVGVRAAGVVLDATVAAGSGAGNVLAGGGDAVTAGGDGVSTRVLETGSLGGGSRGVVLEPLVPAVLATASLSAGAITALPS